MNSEMLYLMTMFQNELGEEDSDLDSSIVLLLNTGTFFQRF